MNNGKLMHKILILDEDQSWRNFFLKKFGKLWEISFWPNGEDIFKNLGSKYYDAVFLDLDIHSHKPFDLLNYIHTTLPHTPVVVTSMEERADLIVNAIKQGATNFIPKPFTAERIDLVLNKALENDSLKKEIDYLRGKEEFIYDFDRLIAFSPSMKSVINVLKKYSKTDSTILITGETGTGKSFLSGTIHFNSPRKKRPFVQINCCNIPENLLESELFGHEKGSFTGAEKQRIGRFEQAQGGTIFLDEIGDLSLPLQVRLLRVLEEKAFERVGGNQTIHVDVRIIAATNQNLENLVMESKFREDLYYRINVLSVSLPPLRDRIKCIEPMVYILLHKHCRTLRKKIKGIAPEVIELFKSYSWPGNIRQLSNTIERAIIIEESQTIRLESVTMIPNAMPPPPSRLDTAPSDSIISSFTNAANMEEKQSVLEALKENLWIQKDAAKKLGISPRMLNYKIKKFGLKHPRWRKHK
jgi:DNA-binding NtrC family response regulator